MQVRDNDGSSILAGLKAETREIHHRVEQRLPIFNPEFGLPQYVRLLARFYGFWSPLEARLCRVPELHHSFLGLSGRLKAHLLDCDLRLFGVDPNVVPRCALLPRVDKFSKGLGCLYVLEGSTLGSQMISRRLWEQFRIDRTSGASFFNPYDGSVGERWSEFRFFLISHADPRSKHEILAAARETFESLYEWLAPLDKVHLQGGE